MNTDSQPKKSLSRKRQLMKNEETISLITKNDWNPFERADPKLLEKVTQEFTKQRNINMELTYPSGIKGVNLDENGGYFKKI